MRRLASVLLVVTLFTSVLAEPASGGIPKAITWRVDHTAKTITISVRMTLYPACAEPKCGVLPTDADVVRNQILSVWNQGFSYKCYKLIFDVDVRVDNSATRWSDSPDRLMIRFDQNAGVGFRSGVQFVGGGAWDSDSPSDKLVPINDWLAPSTWSGTVISPFVYAHEFGHLIGLRDTYKDHLTLDGWESKPIPGAPVDVMSGGDHGNVDQTTIDRLVKRSGVVKDSDLKCDYQIDHQVGWYHLTAIKCDTPEGKWEISVEGELALPQGALASTGSYDVELKAPAGKADPTKPLSGKWEGKLDVGLKGVPGASAGAGVHLSGTASFDPMAKKMVLVTKKTVGTSFANVYGYASSGGVDPAKDMTLPVEVGDFCLE